MESERHTSDGGGPTAGSTNPGADEPEYREALVGAHRKSHDLWNARDLAAFIPTFASPIHYSDVPAGHVVSDASKMTDFATKWFLAAPDAKLSGAY